MAGSEKPIVDPHCRTFAVAVTGRSWTATDQELLFNFENQNLSVSFSVSF